MSERRSLGLFPNGNSPASDSQLPALLKDGVLLCTLANTLDPGSIRIIYTNTTFKFKCVENLKSFLRV